MTGPPPRGLSEAKDSPAPSGYPDGVRISGIEATSTMTHRIRSIARTALASAALLAACEGAGTDPFETQDDAARAAQTFTQLADSVARNGGDADVGTTYSGIAGVLRMGGRVTPITIGIDGTATPFMAAAMSVETTVNDCPPGAQCFVPPYTYALRSLIAWDKENPKRIVQLSSADNDDPIGAILDPSPLALYRRMASLFYLDGKGGMYVGTSGTQKFDVTKSATPCPEPAVGDTLWRILRPKGTCVLAEHAVTFSGKVEPSPFVVAGNSATGTHTIAMSAQSVHGTHAALAITPCDPSCVPVTPPVVVRPSTELPATLSAKVSGDVTLTMTVKNPSSEPVVVVYPTAQKYDFVVIDSATGKPAWRWAEGKGFTQAIVQQTVPAGGSLTFVEKWTPPKSGLYLAHGRLTSTSHRSQAYASFVVP